MRSASSSASCASASISSGSATCSPRAARRELDRRSRRRRRHPCECAAASRCDERRLEVGERLCGAVAERDRLLDLEVERHAAVVDAAAVLDRDEREEAEELAGPALPPPRRQRRGRKPASCSSTVSRAAAYAVRRRRAQPRRAGRTSRARARGRLAALRAVCVAQDRRSSPRRAAASAAAGYRSPGRRRRRPSRAQPAAGPGRCRADRRAPLRAPPARVISPFASAAQRERRVGSGAGEARRLAELPDEQPLPVPASASPAATAATTSWYAPRSTAVAHIGPGRRQRGAVAGARRVARVRCRCSIALRRFGRRRAELVRDARRAIGSRVFEALFGRLSSPR